MQDQSLSLVMKIQSGFAQAIDSLNFDRQGLVDYCESIGEKPFRSQQLLKWIHQLGITDFSAMINLSLTLREYLAVHAEIRAPQIVNEQVSQDGTCKWLLELADKNRIETVLIPEENRATLCISTQVGCPMACQFCATGKLGFKRNLEVSEIIGQLYLAVRKLSSDGSSKTHVVTNVVFMGMGEPLLNTENVVKAANIMMDDLAYGLSKYRVTISTCGVVDELKKLRSLTQASLAISLHAPTDELRSEIMPINKKYPLTELMPVLQKYFIDDPKRMVTIEYIMIDGVNDSVKQAKQLLKLLQGLKCKVNLIPYNSGADACGFAPSKQESIDDFRNVLLKAGYNTITRKSRGQDIAAACGQLDGAE